MSVSVQAPPLLRPLHLAALLMVTFVWGLNFIVIRIGLDHFPPLLFSAARFAVCALPALWLPRPKVGWVSLLALGLVLGAGLFGFLFLGIAAGVSPGIASLLMQSQVLFTLVLGALILGDRPGVAQWTAVALGCAGIALLAIDTGQFSTGTGFALILGGAVCWAVANLMFKRLPPTPMLNVMVWISLVPPIPLLALSWLVEGQPAISASLGNIGPVALLVIAYTSVLSTLFGYGVWGAMIQRYSAPKVVPFALFVPVFGLLLSFLIFGDRLDAVGLLASAMVVAALALNTFGFPRALARACGKSVRFFFKSVQV